MHIISYKENLTFARHEVFFLQTCDINTIFRTPRNLYKAPLKLRHFLSSKTLRFLADSHNPYVSEGIPTYYE